MLWQLRDALYRVVGGPDTVEPAAVRLSRDLARRLNTALGRPLAPREELERRASARARLEELRRQPASGPSAARVQEAAPVVVYFEKGRNTRELTRVEEVLTAKGIAWRNMDVSGDDATLDFVTRTAGCAPDDLPVVFVADHAIGPLPSLVEADVSGELARRVFG